MKVLGLVIAVCMVGCGGAPFAVSDSAGDGGVAEVGEDSLTDGSNASVERALTSQDAGPTALSYEASDGPVGEGSSFDAAIPVDSPSAPSPVESGVEEASSVAEAAAEASSPDADPPTSCAASCAGCCDSFNNCITLTTSFECGSGGQQCVACYGSQACHAGACESSP